MSKCVLRLVLIIALSYTIVSCVHSENSDDLPPTIAQPAPTPSAASANAPAPQPVPVPEAYVCNAAEKKRAKTAPKQPKLTGLSRQEISSVITSRHIALSDCYAGALKLRPTLKGKIQLYANIDVEGKVDYACVEPRKPGAALKDQLVDGFLYRCMVDIYRTMTFPKPRNGGAVTLNWPYVFKPE